MKDLKMWFITEDDEKIRAQIQATGTSGVMAEIEKVAPDKFLLYFSEFSSEVEVNAEQFLQLLQQAIDRLKPTT